MTSGLIFDVQHYAVHDGPGIRTLVFFKGCPLRCVWCANPESHANQPELRFASARCQQHLACLHACAAGAIALGDGALQIDRSACTHCTDRACIAACPQSALTLVGETISVDALVERVAADCDFYANSGGGVSFSGGEPLAQAEFLYAVLERCRRLGLHSAVETCGLASRRVVEKVAPLVDLWLYDVKLIDPVRHREHTGADNALVLDNLRWLARRDPARIVVRVPIVPGLTDDDDNLNGIAALLVELGLDRVELMPYHGLGEDKHAALGRRVPFSAAPPSLTRLETIAARLGERGLQCTW